VGVGGGESDEVAGRVGEGEERDGECTGGEDEDYVRVLSTHAHVCVADERYRFLPIVHRSSRSPLSKLEVEANEKLADVMQKLLQAGVDQSESEREVKLKETLSNLQRIFTGASHSIPFYLFILTCTARVDRGARTRGGSL
jgi:hypothetical protein